MTYSGTLSKSLTEYGQALREWSTTECRPYARQADTEHKRHRTGKKFLTRPPSAWSPRHSRCGTDSEFDEGYWITKLVFYENINYGDVWVNPVVGGGGIGHLVVQSMGTPEQIDRWYTPVMQGALRTAFALTEPQFGSDTTMSRRHATRDGDTWVINGSKIYCTGGSTAEYIVVFATIDKSLGAKGINAFVVPRDTPGLIVTKPNESKLGIRSWITSALSFDGCVIPVENRLGWTEDGSFKPRSSGQGGP